MAAVGLTAVSMLVFAASRYGHGPSLTVVDDQLLERLTALRRPGLTSAMQAVSWLLGSIWTIKVLGGLSLLILVVFRRFRHIVVAFISLEVVSLLVIGLSAVVRRPRPFGIASQGHWTGWAMPSRPVALLAAVLVAMLYSLVPEGRWRQAGKLVAAGLVALLATARMYLGVDAPSDVLVGAVIGVAVPLLAFRWFTPNEVFPITYRPSRSTSLDIGGQRGQAIRHALQDQLGLEIEDVKRYGMTEWAGSTPLLITIKAEPHAYLFGKLYARRHLRADRWYKLGRELLYGRLEDEKPFHTVRRLVQQEDYALHKLYAAGLPTPRPYGFVELTPDWEYLLVTEFFQGATSLDKAQVDQAVIDDGLSIIRQLWDAGLAHRDLQPANLLVRDGQMLLVNMVVVEARPSPWRQAVDLANMMLCLGLRSDPGLVYERALRQFSVQEIGEAFAASRGLASPSQLRHLLREQGGDLHAEFLRLLPERPRPVSIQRWNPRRVGLALLVVLGLVIVIPVATYWSVRTDRINTSLYTSDVGCDSREPLWLMAQAVPSATLVPCMQLVPVGWTVAEVRVQDGRSRITFDTDRAGKAAVVVELAASCDLAGAVEMSSEQPGARRYVQINRSAPKFSATSFYVFSGGCVVERFGPDAARQAEFASTASLGLGFVTRDELRQTLRQHSRGRLRLDPGTTQ